MKAGRTSRASQIVAATIGNALEWYDFLIFGYLTAIVSKLFFPTGNEYCSLLAATATFGVGFFMRPVGGIAIGMYADKHGRKAALQLIIVLIMVSMAMMAFAPTYAAFGIGAPLLIVVARLLQGFATGGEFSSSTAFLVECATPNKRGLYGSWQMFGQVLAMLGGTAMGAAITTNLSPEALNAWGWRIPFFAGMLIAPVGFWIRRHLEDPEMYVRAHKRERPADAFAPLKKVFSDHLKPLAVCFGLITAGTISTYILNVYMAVFATKHLGLTLSQTFAAQFAAGFLTLMLIPLSGALSDRIGRKPVLLGSMCLYLVMLYPCFSWILANPSQNNLVLMLLALNFARAGYGGVMSSVLAEQFPTTVRSTGMAVSYNVAVMVFGGTAQVFLTWLIQTTGAPVSTAFYLMSATVVGIISACFIKEPAFLEELVEKHAEEKIPLFAK
jgi:MHS family proline/betaine transporter-like MFS transporter